MLDYNHLAALDAVIHEGGFEKAGRILHISQSAVTQRIHQLEELSGQVLLVRSQPPVPTAQGRKLLEHFKKVRLLEMELDMEDSGAGTAEKPLISLAVNSDSLATWFAPVIRDFAAENTGYLKLITADQDITHRLLSEGEVMGCISASPAPVRGCRIEALGKMVYRAVCTRDYYDRFFPRGLTREAFEKAPKLNFNRDDLLLAKWAQRLFPGVDSFRESHFVPSSEQFPHLISGGGVCGMIPDDQFREFEQRSNLLDLSSDHPVEVPLFWQRWALESGEIELLGNLIKREAARYLLRS